MTQAEERSAIRRHENNKSPGVDEIYAEVLKLLEDKQVDIVTKLFNNVHEIDNLPKNWYVSVLVQLPKKVNAKKFEEHKIIAHKSRI